ncbi:hypothetical protein AB9N12_01370 [Bacteroides sp. AN502(2024)]|uniref:hypothetical protein n=1 Tax=Bacteroides sp. AN502(2024) TaxID=3160599 RepID=UPI003518C784
MGVTSLYDFTKQFAELQSRFQLTPEYPAVFLKDYLENMSSQLLKLTEIQQVAMPDLSWINIYPFSTGTSQSSQYVTLDSEDGINEECVPIDNSGDVSSGRIVQRTSKDSTNSADMNRMNEEFYSSLSKRTQNICMDIETYGF